VVKNHFLDFHEVQGDLNPYLNKYVVILGTNSYYVFHAGGACSSITDQNATPVDICFIVCIQKWASLAWSEGQWAKSSPLVTPKKPVG